MRCVIHDFNNVRRASERIRVVEANVGSGERREFNQFISDMGVDDIPINGRRFTCCRLNGKAISRLDRMLVSREWIAKWSGCSQYVGEWDISNNCPLVMKNVVVD